MIRILHVLKSPRAEGTPRLVLDWLSVETYTHGVAFLTRNPPELLGEFRRTGCWIQSEDGDLRPGLAKSPQVVASVRKAVRAFRPDVVIAWAGGLAHLIHAGARSASRCKLLTHAGTAPGVTFNQRYLYTWLCFGGARLCGHTVVACSNYVRSQYLQIPFLSRRHVRSVFNCCSVSRFVPADPAAFRPPRVCMVGSLERSKNYPNLLRAWQRVQAAGDFELVIAGDGSRRRELEEMARDLGLRNVRFLGATRDVPGVLWDSRVFAFSANPEEGFGTVLIEALAAGCRVVATDVPACREVLQDGSFGSLVPPNDPEALAKSIIEAIRRPYDTEEGDRAIRYARSFTPERMAAEYLKLVDVLPMTAAASTAGRSRLFFDNAPRDIADRRRF